MISVAGVTKFYERARVLDQIHLELGKGEFLYLLGGTGAGKSTLLRILSTEELPDAGTVSLFGYDLATVSGTALRAIRQSIGTIPQDIRLIPDFSVLDNVALSVSLGGRRALPAQARSRINDLLERLGLGPRRDQMAMTLSRGEAQRVAVARALARCPELILADEPTGAQDRDSAWGLMDLFLKANLTGAAVILATHDREIVRRVRKRCAVLKSGRLLLEESLCTY
ncbi:MAG: hypothetical protein A2428_02705 [Bdellovibrionales bacterium RIFOXYC1_FULL_54_43]|nr:MAG: hypothetical protein A2428_02705 [Bdellovibrionales bacterium RIFOXYC1_FULL_54_43]OFZ81723.1 MAG: hypothetical protein A2603_09620 [Bdellovibrionales bacterium RIFOXYD1_FULL_55_31]